MKKYIRAANGFLSLLSLLTCAAILSMLVFRMYSHSSVPHIKLEDLAASGVISVKKIDSLLAIPEVLSRSVCVQTARYGYYCKIDASSIEKNGFTSHGYNVEIRHGMAFWYDSDGRLRMTSRY